MAGCHVAILDNKILIAKDANMQNEDTFDIYDYQQEKERGGGGGGQKSKRKQY